MAIVWLCPPDSQLPCPTHLLKPFGSDEMNLWMLVIVAASMISPLRGNRCRGRFPAWCSHGSSNSTRSVILSPERGRWAKSHYSKVSECEGREEGEREAEGEERRGECTNSWCSLTSCPPTETDLSWQSYPRSIELFFRIQYSSEDRLLSSVKQNKKRRELKREELQQ